MNILAGCQFPFEAPTPGCLSLPISDAYFYRLKKEADSLSERLKSWSSTADIAMKCYMIFGAVLSVVSAIPLPIFQQISHGLLIISLTGVIWNLIDSAGGICFIPALLKQAADSALHVSSKKMLSYLHTVYFTTVLPALSLWGFATTVQSIKTAGLKAVLSSGAALGATAALAASAFAFAGGMFVAAGFSGFSWYRATQKVDPVALLQDRLKKYDALTLKINACENNPEKKIILEKKQNRIQQQVSALFFYCENDEKIKTKLTDAEKSHSAVTKQSDLQNSEKSKIATYLIQKQQDKLKEKRFDCMANIAGGLGALLGGLALLIPPAAIPLVIVGVTFFMISAAMKAYQLYQKRALKNNQESVVGLLSENQLAVLSDNDKKRVSALRRAGFFSAQPEQPEKDVSQDDSAYLGTAAASPAGASPAVSSIAPADEADGGAVTPRPSFSLQ